MTPQSTRRQAPVTVPRTMRSGVRGASDLQVFLRDLGYFKGRIDGFYGNTTRNAVANYQKDLGVNVTGHFDQATHDAAVAANTSEVALETSPSSSPPSPTTPPSRESEPSSRPTSSSSGSSKPATASEPSSAAESSRTTSTE